MRDRARAERDISVLLGRWINQVRADVWRGDHGERLEAHTHAHMAAEIMTIVDDIHV